MTATTEMVKPEWKQRKGRSNCWQSSLVDTETFGRIRAVVSSGGCDYFYFYFQHANQKRVNLKVLKNFRYGKLAGTKPLHQCDPSLTDTPDEAKTRAESVLTQLATGKPSYLDVTIDTPQQLKERRRKWAHGAAKREASRLNP